MSRKCCLCGTWEYKLPKETNITFHSVPKEGWLRKQWLDAIDMKDIGDLREISLCSVHFSIKDFQILPSERIVLKNGAMPVRVNRNTRSRQTSTCSPWNNFSRSASQPSTSTKTHIFAPSVQVAQPLPTVDESQPASAPTISTEWGECADDDEEEVEMLDSSCSTSTASETERLVAAPRPKRFCRKAYIGDIRDEDFAHPERARQAFLIAKAKIDLQKKTIKGLQQTVMRLHARVDRLIAKISMLGKTEQKPKRHGFRIVRRRRLQRIGNHRYIKT